MAGISIVISDNNLPGKQKELRKNLDSFNYLLNISSYIFQLQDKIFIGWNKYEEYPISEIAHKHYLILLEGKIYNKSLAVVTSEVEKIIDSLESDKLTYLKDWLQETDGDFILYLYNNYKNELYIIDDIFGRIPIYYTQVHDQIIVSRQLKFMTNLIKDFQFDKMAFLEIILMGFPLGSRTLIKNINQLEPASLISIKNNVLRKIKIYDFNFEIKLHENKSFSENIHNISDLFSKSTTYRFNKPGKNIVALSGGVDSRAVAASLFYNKIEFTSLSMKYISGHEARDLEIARRLSHIFNSEWRALEVAPAKGSELKELLYLKEGMNSLFTATMINFYKEITKAYGNKINYITGDNGDKLIFTIDQPLRKFQDYEELIKYTIEDRALIPLNEIKQIFPFDENDLFEELHTLYNSYSEHNLTQKFIHFRVLEKPFKYAFQGEDRHRNYLWNSSPFWSFPFYNYLMNCPDEMKKRHKTFRSWLQSYSKDAVDLEYTNFRSSIASVRGRIFMLLVYNVYPKVPVNFKRFLKASFFPGNPTLDINSPLIQVLLNQKNNKVVSNYFKIPDSKTLSNKRKSSLYPILTLSSAIEFFNNENLTLNQYTNDIFG